jgi:hypothetical protein
MATQVQWRGGSTAEHATFTGAAREVTVDTQKQTLVLHDGSTAGGRPLLREDGSNAALSLGSAGTPSLKFTGDTNTGIYSPGADQVAVATNGTGRLFVDSAGKVGIGTSSPGVNLEVSGDSADLVLTNVTNNNATGANKSLNCGVGGATAFSIAPWQNSGFIDSATTNGLALGASSSTGSVRLCTGTSREERLRITSAGLVGIGTSTPSNTAGFGQQVEIAGTLPCLTLNQNDVGYTTRKYSLSVNAVGCFGVWDNTASNHRLYIDTSGNVGIGTTSPAAQLNVSQSTGSSIVKLNGLNGYDLLISNTQDSGTLYDFNIGSGSGAFSFTTSAGERARIDSSGRFLVGTSSARENFYNSTNSAHFQIEGSGSNDNYALSIVSNYAGNTSGAQVILAKSGGSSVGDNALVSDGNTIGQINFQGADGTEFVEAAKISAEIDGTPGANDMPGRIVFSTTADGDSSPTERMRITATGLVSIKSDSGFTNGIKYDNGATSSAQHYDRIYFGAASYYIINNSSVGVRLDDGATSWSAQSDERLKTNLTEISDGLGKIGTLRAVTGRYLNDETTVSRSFLIAQDVRDVLPEAVSEDSDDSGTLNLRYTEVIPLLVAALKESKERIEQLETEA